MESTQDDAFTGLKKQPSQGPQEGLKILGVSKKNPVHQTGNFKLKDVKNQVQIDSGFSYIVDKIC